MRCELIIALGIMEAFYPLALCISITGLLAFRYRIWAISNLQKLCSLMSSMVPLGIALGWVSMLHWIWVQDGVSVFVPSVTPKFERLVCLYGSLTTLYWVKETLRGSD